MSANQNLLAVGDVLFDPTKVVCATFQMVSVSVFEKCALQFASSRKIAIDEDERRSSIPDYPNRTIRVLVVTLRGKYNTGIYFPQEDGEIVWKYLVEHNLIGVAV